MVLSDFWSSSKLVRTTSEDPDWRIELFSITVLSLARTAFEELEQLVYCRGGTMKWEAAKKEEEEEDTPL